MKKIIKKAVVYARKRRKGVAFIVFFSFLISFILSRSFVILTNDKYSLMIKGYEIHHLVLGIILLSIGGAIGISYRNGFIRTASVIYGAGLGLIADEFGLLITWGDYWSRFAYDFALIITLIFLNILFFSNFWRFVGRKTILPMVERIEKRWDAFVKKAEEEYKHWKH
ncbi:MAG: hypothetical protein J7K22_01895 [Nanoarchaeota archaeon]|nr:hypothetical protein [Nanoarchaeota archaeon]